MAIVDRPEVMTDEICIHGEMMSLAQAEERGLVVVAKDAKGRPMVDPQGTIRYVRLSSSLPPGVPPGTRPGVPF